MNLISYISKCVVAFQQLWDKAERRSEKQVSKLDKKMFIMMICLSLPENLLQREKISINKIEKILEQNFVDVDEQDNYQIVSYMGNGSEGNVKVIYMEIILNIYYKIWNSDGERDRYIQEMLYYPFLGWLINMYGIKSEIVKKNVIECRNKTTNDCEKVYTREDMEECLERVRMNFLTLSRNVEELARMAKLIKTAYVALVKMGDETNEKQIYGEQSLL